MFRVGYHLPSPPAAPFIPDPMLVRGKVLKCLLVVLTADAYNLAQGRLRHDARQKGGELAPAHVRLVPETNPVLRCKAGIDQIPVFVEVVPVVKGFAFLCEIWPPLPQSFRPLPQP